MRRSFLYAIGLGAVLLLALVWLSRQSPPGAKQQTSSSNALTASETQRGPRRSSGAKGAVARPAPPRPYRLPPLEPPPRLQAFVADRFHHPTWEDMKPLSTEDIEILKRLYAHETNLVSRYPLTIALGMRGDGEVVDMFIYALTVEHRGREAPLTNGTSPIEEQGVMLATVQMLGPLAGTHDASYSFLLKSMNPDFWAENANLAEATIPGFSVMDLYTILAGRSLVALGSSGRTEVSALFEQLKVQPFMTERYTDGRHTLHGALVDGAFAYDVALARGPDFWRTHYDTDVARRLLPEWRETENGRRWREWSRQARGLPPLEPKPVQSQP